MSRVVSPTNRYTKRDAKKTEKKARNSNNQSSNLGVVLSDTWSASSPVKTLVVAEDKVVSVELVDDTVNAAVSRDALHLAMSTRGKTSATAGLKRLAKLLCVSLGGFRLEQGDGETAWFEDVHSLADNFSGATASLLLRHGGFKRCIGAVGFGRDVDGEIVGAGFTVVGRDDAVG